MVQATKADPNMESWCKEEEGTEYLNRDLKVGQQLAHARALVDPLGDQLQHVGDCLHGLCAVLHHKLLHRHT